MTQELRAKYYGNVEKHGLVIRTISEDLKNILVMTTIIDCQNAEQQQKSNNTVDGKFHDDQQKISELTVVNNFAHWPVDVNAGSHTMLLYCDLVQNETLGDTQTALLVSIPLDILSSTNQYMRELSHWSFSDLQWKWIYKSQIQSITLPSVNEMDQRILLWVVVEQALLWHLGLNHIEQKCASGVTSNEDWTLPTQKLDPSCLSFRKQILN